jgi:hypothetical protein
MTYGDAPSRESSRFFARERRSARVFPPLSPRLSRSLFNRGLWVNNLVGFGGPDGIVLVTTPRFNHQRDQGIVLRRGDAAMVDTFDENSTTRASEFPPSYPAPFAL